MNKIGLAPLTIIKAGPVEFISAAAASGFDFVTLRLVPPRPGDPYAPLVEDSALLRAARRRLVDTGLSVLDVEAIWLGPETDVGGFAPIFDVAAELGAKHVLTVGNDPDLGRTIDNVSALADLASRYGMNVALEFITYCHVANLEQALQVLRRVRRPNAGVLIDALQLCRAGVSPSALKAVPPELFLYFQLCDARRAQPGTVNELRAEARGSRLYPGEGELPLAALMDVMPAGIPISVEAPCAGYADRPALEQAQRAAEATRKFLTRYFGERHRHGNTRAST